MQNRFYQPALISNRGFLPEKDPIMTLPTTSELNIALNAVISNLANLVQSKQLRTHINALNVKYSDAKIILQKGVKGQKQAAIFILNMLMQAYIWETPTQSEHQIPAVIGNNLYLLCKNKQRYPTMTYEDYVLQNWRRIDPAQEISLDNIKPIATFTGTRDEEWFIMVHVVIESICAEAIKALVQACNLAAEINAQGIGSNDARYAQLISLFNKIAESLEGSLSVMKRMDEQCKPDAFWRVLRPYLSGTEKVEYREQANSVTVQHGVVLQGVVNKDKRSTFVFKGASGAESSIIPALDAAFKVKHDVDGMHQYLLEFQKYMPSKHRTLIGLLAANKLNKVSSNSNSKELCDAWTLVVSQVHNFRKQHLNLVHKFIYTPARADGIPRDAITGTGGAPIDGYLGARAAATDDHKRNGLDNASSTADCPFHHKM